MPSDAKLLASLDRLLRHVASTLDVPLTVVLWDGSEVPLGKTSAGMLRIRSAGTVASLLKRPKPENLVDHYARGNIAIEGDLITLGGALRKQVRSRDLKRLDKWLILRALLPFLLVRGEKVRAQHRDDAGGEHRNARNRDYIRFHYDVGNDFYRLFLDPEMQYSCAYFTDAGNSIAQAQQDKLEMICRKLRLKEGERFLDIGCGWGGLLCYAAQHYGVIAHGITLSQEQYDFTKEKIRALGLEERVTVEIRDYLTLEGQYDKIASIGMFEHIGLANFPAYFGKIRSLLRERGIVLNHGIARRAKADVARGLKKITPEKRLILKYIFPGAELAPIGHSLNSMEGNGFEIHDVEAWREHYALTCTHWYRRLAARPRRASRSPGRSAIIYGWRTLPASRWASWPARS
ncbi:MAG: cyclopropane-fatty-acyl-phospholipid synthase family protein [Alphaproteobacteria bacterium]